MKKKLILLISLLAGSMTIKAADIERKIIVENGMYHYITISEEHQLATLHYGSIQQPLSQGTLYPLPFGRNFEEPFVLFSWDKKGDHFLGNNMLRHPLNDWGESIKRIRWQEVIGIKNEGKQPFDLIMEGIDHFLWMYNQPFVDLRRNDYSFEDFYSDLVLIDSNSLLYLITNKGKATLWIYRDHHWKLIQRFDKKLHAYSLLYFAESVWIIQPGYLLELDPQNGNIIREEQIENFPGDFVLVEDRDRQCIGIINNEHLHSEQPFYQLSKNYILEFKKL